MKEALLKSLLHLVGVVVALGVAWVLIKVLGVDSAVYQSLIALVLVALEKFLRTSNMPVPDYVNR